MEAKNAQAREKLIEAEEDEIARSYPLYHHGDPYDELDETGNAHGLPQLETLPPDEMLRQFSGINISAPMVRYSKLPARFLWSRYNTHITYTPMMLAREFARSATARDAEFTTNNRERGIFTDLAPGRRVRGNLVAQFAARSGPEFADAVEIMHPWVDGIDLNCGCPQSWAYKEEIGSYLLRQPDTVRDIIRTARARVSSNYPISIKIRIDKDRSNTSQLINTAIHAGASYIAVHGRTRYQKDTEPVNLPGIKFAYEEARGRVPIVGNGDIFHIDDVKRMHEQTGVKAVMSARGMLYNPALFAGYDKTPLDVIDQFLDISTAVGLIWPLFHRHMAYMLDKHFTNKAERTAFNALKSHAGVMDWCDVFLEKRRRGDMSSISIPTYDDIDCDLSKLRIATT